MRIEVSGNGVAEARVSIVEVNATIFASGKSEAICNRVASDTLGRVLQRYKESLKNISFTSVVMGNIRCVDEIGILSTEHDCRIRIQSSGKDIFKSLRTLNTISEEMSGEFMITGWTASVDEKDAERAKSKAISSAFEAAQFEAKCISGAINCKNYEISDIVVRPWDTLEFSQTVELPDISSDDRAYIFNNLPTFVETSVKVVKCVMVAYTI